MRFKRLEKLQFVTTHIRTSALIRTGVHNNWRSEKLNCTAIYVVPEGPGIVKSPVLSPWYW